MKFIKLHFYRGHKKYGAKAGPTEKAFFLRTTHISYIVPYHECTKIVLEHGAEIEVNESEQQIFLKLAGTAQTSYTPNRDVTMKKDAPTMNPLVAVQGASD